MLIKRIRGALTLAALWACAWVPVGVFFGVRESLGPYVCFDDCPTPLSYVLGNTVLWTVLGGVSGACFSIVLAAVERGRSVDQLSGKRLALWGAFSGVLLPAIGYAFVVLGLQVAPADFVTFLWVTLGIAPLEKPETFLVAFLLLGAVSGALTLTFASRHGEVAA